LQGCSNRQGDEERTPPDTFGWKPRHVHIASLESLPTLFPPGGDIISMEYDDGSLSPKREKTHALSMTGGIQSKQSRYTETKYLRPMQNYNKRSISITRKELPGTQKSSQLLNISQTTLRAATSFSVGWNKSQNPTFEVVTPSTKAAAKSSFTPDSLSVGGTTKDSSPIHYEDDNINEGKKPTSVVTWCFDQPQDPSRKSSANYRGGRGSSSRLHAARSLDPAAKRDNLDHET